MGGDVANRFSVELGPRNLGGLFLDRFFVLPDAALVRVELLLNSRLPQLTWIGRELHVTRLADPERWSVAGSFQNTKPALCHISVSHSCWNRATFDAVKATA